jgi:hypothetical protein
MVAKTIRQGVENQVATENTRRQMMDQANRAAEGKVGKWVGVSHEGGLGIEQTFPPSAAQRMEATWTYIPAGQKTGLPNSGSVKSGLWINSASGWRQSHRPSEQELASGNWTFEQRK